MFTTDHQLGVMDNKEAHESRTDAGIKGPGNWRVREQRHKHKKYNPNHEDDELYSKIDPRKMVKKNSVTINVKKSRS